MRQFETGATRDDEAGKPDYEGYLSPLVIQAFGAYMAKHQVQADGKLRASDNWQKGMGRPVYIKSLWRHFLDLWLFHRGLKGRETIDDALAGCMFNLQGYWFEYLNDKSPRT